MFQIADTHLLLYSESDNFVTGSQVFWELEASMRVSYLHNSPTSRNPYAIPTQLT